MKATGTEIVLAAKKAAAWFTAVACAAGDGLFLTDMKLARKQSPLMDESLGKAFHDNADPGPIKVEGTLDAWFRYDGLDLLIAMLFGTTGGAPVQQAATAAYAQSFTLASTLEGLFCTLAAYNGVSVEEFISAKFAGLEIKGKVGEPVEVSFKVIADEMDPESAVNTSATMANVTMPEALNRVLFSQGVFRMNDQDGAALDSDDEIAPNSFSIIIERKLAGVHAAGQSNKIDEPSNTNMTEVLLKLGFPRYTSKQDMVDWVAATEKKADIVFTGSLIEDTYYRTQAYSFPRLAHDDVALKYSQGIMENEVVLHALLASAAPTGMSGITLPVQLDVINTKTTDVLA